MAKFSMLALGAVLAAAGALAAPQFASAEAPAKNNYADGATWLCKPGRKDACAVDLDSTVVKADGTTSVDRFKPAADPK
ncbi:hypothetical protein ABTL57_19000, partial [Acinetobacter baumannii]